MSEVEALLAELRALPAIRPGAPDELDALLTRIKSAAARWADVLYEVQESAQPYATPRTAAALEVAFRRAEQSYVELEIALNDPGRP
ncbi:hypothetical protein GCM10010329_56900 [Streptomyces spiroverticillatus]|uniref:Uncharacterized protein n=1 Tax=Streptomyces finlayi TaxID=67296 RepID=A0A918X3D1_9ACTN|nr:hypothetical protein [Streptomyces finlayi]GHA26330.1 hypothetical protein GCM10010329_56900 [Streptomyces spiroverticillatus]GHD07866.1 hypothetical protein GCM10010334_60570 [Streptomyces finlayi]